jgi:hypothetical protein
MSKIITEYDAKAALSQLEREVKASNVLSKPESKLPYYLVVTVGTGVLNFFVNSSGFEAPVVIRTILVTGLLIGVVNMIDNHFMRRKLDAAIALLLIQEKRRATEEGGTQ